MPIKQFLVFAYVADEELEDVLNKGSDSGYDVYSIFRNKQMSGDVGSSTVIMKLRTL